MKILPDESLPTKLREYIIEEHHVFTVRDMNWELTTGNKRISA